MVAIAARRTVGETERVSRSSGTKLVLTGVMLAWAAAGCSSLPTLQQLATRWSRVGNPGAFCRRVMHNIVIDRACAQQRRPRELFTIRDSGDSRSGDPVTAVELRPALLAGLGALTSQQRAIVVLRYFEDMSENEVADLLGISVSTVKSTASRAVAQLRVQPGLIALFAATDTPGTN
jgi:RNA polymerase sigma factor (sigma-70 family)